MARHLKKKPAGVRWAKLRELDRRIKIGSATFNKLPYRIRQLSAWRADHLSNSHRNVRAYARKKGVKPSSDITLGTKVTYFLSRKKRGLV
jgi:hypothetical protein